LQEQGLDIYLDRHPEKLHHKIMIIDQKIVVTGSYNLTRSAEVQNDENTLIIHDEKIASVFLNEFEWIFEDASSR
jgi:phosphatidylserine/phosphatidylglycerophosphate/cardiolipin synthase-like enzyme